MTALTLSGVALGLDVGGTKTAIIGINESGRMLLHETVLTNSAELQAQLLALCTTARLELAEAGHQLVAVGVAVPGQVDPLGRRLDLAVNLGTPSLALADLLEAELGLPAVIEHDARAAAHWLQLTSVERETHLAYLSVGTGISAGVVLGGRLLRGARGLAGEIGHISVQPDGPLCRCGLRGCLEAVAAGPALARLAAEARDNGRRTSLAASAGAREVFIAAAEGDSAASAIIDSVAAHLARAVRALVLAYGLRRVVIGGGVAGAGAPLIERIEAHLRQESQGSTLVEAALRGATVELLSPDSLAGARGAAALARSRAAATPPGVNGERASRDSRDPPVAQREGVGSP